MYSVSKKNVLMYKHGKKYVRRDKKYVRRDKKPCRTTRFSSLHRAVPGTISLDIMSDIQISMSDIQKNMSTSQKRMSTTYFQFFSFFSCNSCWIDLLKKMSTSIFSCLTFQILCRTCHISCRPDVDALFRRSTLFLYMYDIFFVPVDTQNVTSYSCQCDRTQVNVTYLKYGSLTPSTYGTEEVVSFWEAK